MLLEFRVENHRSIQTEQALSLEGSSTDGTRVQEGETPTSVPPVLPVALIYGANASGKSNVLSALHFMTNAVFHSQRRWEPQGRIPREPFAWAGKRGETSLFEVTALVDQVRMTYGFTVSDTKVDEEWLFAWPKGRKQVWFERENTSSFKFGEHLKGPNDAVRELTRDNSLFLSAAAQQGHRQLLPLFSWFRRVVSFEEYHSPYWRLDPVYFDLFFPQPHLFPDQAFGIAAADEIRRLLSMADTGVVDLRIATEGEARKGGSRILLQHQKDDPKSWLELENESVGTQSLVRIAPSLFRVLHEGGVLIIDELERSLHPCVCAAILELFLRRETNPHHAQLIATTHDTALLGNSLGQVRLAREHIWFTEKDKSGATVLYPLTDYKPRPTENLERGYLQGRYGAIPFLGDVSWITKEG